MLCHPNVKKAIKNVVSFWGPTNVLKYTATATKNANMNLPIFVKPHFQVHILIVSQTVQKFKPIRSEKTRLAHNFASQSYPYRSERGLAKPKRFRIVLASGGAQSASRQSRARAGDRRRHATASGQDRWQ